MVDENIIKIKGGRYETTSQVVFVLLINTRHILQELTVPSYVPNDTYLISGNTVINDETASSFECHPSMLILTGPNYSGKSAYIKQVGDFVPHQEITSLIQNQVALIVFLAQVGRYVLSVLSTVHMKVHVV